MKNVTINLYSFAELNEKAKQKAIAEHSQFLAEVAEDEDELNESYEDDYVIENIEANDYVYYFDGTLASCVTYCGKHEKAGTTEFTIHGETFNLV